MFLVFCGLLLISLPKSGVKKDDCYIAKKPISLIEVLANVAVEPSLIEANSSCHLQQLPRLISFILLFSYSTNCDHRYPSCQNQTGLTGEILVTKRKIVLMILFSFELDTLEIALREQQDLVDKIFIVESSSTHKGVRRQSSQSKVTCVLGSQASHLGDNKGLGYV